MRTDAPKLLLPGGNGFLGNRLANWFAQCGWSVVILTRRPTSARPGVRYIHWDGESLRSWARELEPADALVNLAGRSVNCRYHSRNRRASIRG